MSYVFLPWLRRGISTQISRADGDPSTGGRGSVNAVVTFAPGPSTTSPVTVPLTLYGPGDVKSFDARAVTRHWPRPDVFEVEPNFFPQLELFPPDLPWRYTPAKANTQDRLRPWLA